MKELWEQLSGVELLCEISGSTQYERLGLGLGLSPASNIDTSLRGNGGITAGLMDEVIMMSDEEVSKSSAMSLRHALDQPVKAVAASSD